MPESQAKLYEGRIRSGNILLWVHTEDGVGRSHATQVFETHAPSDISTAGEESVAAARAVGP